MVAAPTSVCVHRLDLRAQSRDDVLPFRNDLEDALRTASLPSLPRGASLHIRRLALGRLPRGLSRQSLSALVGQRLAETRAEVLTWASPPQPASAAAIIPDPVTGAALALKAALDRKEPHWAVTERFPGVDWTIPGEAAARILEILFARGGAAAVGRLAFLPVGPGLLTRSLEATSDAAVRNWLASVIAGLPEGLRAALVPWTETVSEIKRSHDLRGDHRPREALLLEAAFADASPGLRTIIAEAVALWGARAPRTVLLSAWVGAGLAGPTAAPEVTRRLIAVSRVPETQGEEPVADPEEVRAVATARALENYPPDEAHLENHQGMASHPRSRPPHSLGTIDDLPEIGGDSSDLAGLWLLLPVLRLIGAEAAENAMQVPVCRDLMYDFAVRGGLPGTDPLRVVLDSALPVGLCDAPGPWAPDDSILRLLAGHRSLSLSRTGQGRAALGLRHGPAGFARIGARDLRRYRASGLAFRLRPATPRLSLQVTRTSLTLSAQWLISRLTGRGWRYLMARKGRVLVSPTHVDITFDGRDVDPIVRMSGLDLDPGWVPWLGRIVSYHYDYSQVGDWALPSGRNGR